MRCQSDDVLIEQVSSYDGSLLQLGRIIASLDAIWSLHTEWSESKRKKIRSNWAILEQIYAQALDEGRQKLNAKDALDIRSMLKIIKEQLTDLFGGPNSEGADQYEVKS